MDSTSKSSDEIVLDTPHRAAERSTKEGRRATLAAVGGSFIEYYDFALYGAAAALVFGPLFFPGVSPTAGVLASFATFAVGFAARPIGAVVVAHFGDRVGRKPGLMFSISLMGAATVLVGLLPTYETAGVLAPILLVALRFLQGLGAGAELAGANTYIIEHNRVHRPTFYSSLIVSAVSLGLSAATLTFLAVSAMPREQLLGGGWRIPFLASAVIFAVVAYLRTRVGESPEFLEEKEVLAKEAPKPPIVEILRARPTQVAVAALALVSVYGFSFVGNTFMLSYLQNTIGLPSSTALTAGLTSTLVAALAAPLFGILGDKVGAVPVLAGGAIFVLVSAFPFFALVQSGSSAVIVVALAVWYCLGWASMTSVAGVFAARLFETRYRYTGLAVTRELPAAVVGGTTPLIATALVAAGGGRPWFVAWYLVATSLVTLLALGFAVLRSRRDPGFFVDI